MNANYHELRQIYKKGYDLKDINESGQILGLILILALVFILCVIVVLKST